MIEQGTRDYVYKIINVGSIPSPARRSLDVIPYSMSKHAVLGLIKGGAKALVGHNITVNGYGPGIVRTELWEQLDKDLVEIGMFEKEGESMDSLAEGMILMKRYSYPEDVLEQRVSSPVRLRLHDRPIDHDRRRHGSAPGRHRAGVHAGVQAGVRAADGVHCRGPAKMRA